MEGTKAPMPTPSSSPLTLWQRCVGCELPDRRAAVQMLAALSARAPHQQHRIDRRTLAVWYLSFTQCRKQDIIKPIVARGPFCKASGGVTKPKCQGLQLSREIQENRSEVQGATHLSKLYKVRGDADTVFRSQMLSTPRLAHELALM